MNWNRGFKRIILVLAILSGVTCASVAVSITVGIHNREKSYLKREKAAKAVLIRGIEATLNKAGFSKQEIDVYLTSVVPKRIKVKSFEEIGKSYPTLKQRIDVVAQINKKLEIATKRQLTVDDLLSMPLSKEIDELITQEGSIKLVEKGFWVKSSLFVVAVCVLAAGLGGAVAGYVGTWVILWYGGLAIWYVGLAIFILVGWLILGFANKNPKDEQKQ